MKLNNVQIGGDPEFGFAIEDQEWWTEAVSGRQSVNGNPESVMLNIPSGYRQLRLIQTDIFAPRGERSDPNLPIGQDGHPDIGEFRIPPAEDPIQFVDNLSKQIAELDEMVLDYENRRGVEVNIIGGPAILDDPMGGHLHTLAHTDSKVCEVLVKCVDLVMMPVILTGYGPGERFRRTYTKPGSQDPRPYGRPGDARFGWSPSRHRPRWNVAAMDYRVLSSYISHPELTGAVAALYWMVAHAFHTNNLPDLPTKLLVDPEIEQAFINVDRGYIMENLGTFLAFWRSFPMYENKHIKKMIRPVMDMFQVRDMFYPFIDIRQTWGIVENRRALPEPRNVLNSEEKLWLRDRPRERNVSEFLLTSGPSVHSIYYDISDTYSRVRTSDGFPGIVVYEREDGGEEYETNDPSMAQALEEVGLPPEVRSWSDISYLLASRHANRGFSVIGVPDGFQRSDIERVLSEHPEVEWVT